MKICNAWKLLKKDPVIGQANFKKRFPGKNGEESYHQKKKVARAQSAR